MANINPKGNFKDTSYTLTAGAHGLRNASKLEKDQALVKLSNKILSLTDDIYKHLDKKYNWD